MSNPLDDFLEEYGPEVKEAAPNLGGALKQFGRSDFGRAMTGGFGAAGAAAAIGGAGMAVDKVLGAATKGRDFRQMMAYNQDLHEHHERDPRLFNQMFTSLRTMNPSFSKDPLVAGTYMRRMLESPASAGGILTDSLGARDKFPNLVSRATDEAIGTSKSYFAKRPPPKPDADPNDPNAQP